MAHHVFISYSHRDAETAFAVCAALEADGIRCWIAPRDARAGQAWKGSIVEAIRTARALVLVYSGASNGSKQVHREVDLAFEASPPVPVIPFRIEDVPLSDELLYCIGASHWLDALTPPLGPHVERLKAAIGEFGPPTGGAPDSARPDAPPTRAEGARAGPRARTWGRLIAAAVLVAAAVPLGRLALGGARPPAAARPDRPRTLSESVIAPAPAPTARPRPSGAGLPSAGVSRPDTAGLGTSRSHPSARASAVHPDGGRGAARAPDSPATECARLLERVSLGEPLSEPESARLEHHCRRGPT